MCGGVEESGRPLKISRRNGCPRNHPFRLVLHSCPIVRVFLIFLLIVLSHYTPDCSVSSHVMQRTSQRLSWWVPSAMRPFRSCFKYVHGGY